MKKRTLWLLGGAAAGGYMLYRYSKRVPQSKSLSGLGSLGGVADDWQNAYETANATYNKVAASIEPLPDKLKSGYAVTLYQGAGSVLKQLELSYDYGVNKKDYVPATLYANAALKNVQRIVPLINNDLADPTGAKSADIIEGRLKSIAATQQANEAERQLAEQGALAYIAAKTGKAAGEVVGSVAKGAGFGIKEFLKQIPWWVYVGGAAAVGLYFAKDNTPSSSQAPGTK
jgi:hypothetical protein